MTVSETHKKERSSRSKKPGRNEQSENTKKGKSMGKSESSRRSERKERSERTERSERKKSKRNEPGPELRSKSRASKKSKRPQSFYDPRKYLQHGTYSQLSCSIFTTCENIWYVYILFIKCYTIISSTNNFITQQLDFSIRSLNKNDNEIKYVQYWI